MVQNGKRSKETRSKERAGEVIEVEKTGDGAKKKKVKRNNDEKKEKKGGKFYDGK